jgi:hypothetical protein
MGVLRNRLTGETNEPEGMNWLRPSRSELEEEQRGFRYTWALAQARHGMVPARGAVPVRHRLFREEH